jgi:hypothetical protein
MENAHGKVISEIGVAMAVERLLRAGFLVAVPIVDDGYDLLAFDSRRYWRIQVKASASTGKWSRTRIRISCGKKKNVRYCPKHVDAFIAVNITTHVVMCVPVSATNGRSRLNWSEADRWQDMGVLRTIKPQRC